MRRTSLTVVAAVLAVAGSGCGGDADTAGTEAEAAPTATPTPTPEPSPTPEPEPTPELPAVGEEQNTDLGGTVAVLDYEQPVATDAPEPSNAGYPDGHVWGALDVRVCVPDYRHDDGDWYITTTPWSLMYDDGSLVGSSHTGYNGFPEPAYPWGDQVVAPGQCVRGWIVFPVPGDDRPEGVHYTGGDSVLQWAVESD